MSAVALLGVAASGPGSLVFDAAGRVLVTARVASLGASTIAVISALGASVTFIDRALRSVTMAIAPGSLQALASLHGVQYVGEELAPMGNATCPSGAYVSEGDAQLNAAAARKRFGVNGRGVTVGVISDSYNYKGGAPGDVAAGELPGTTNPCGDTTPVKVLRDGGTTDEGRAMAQIVHDLAPGAAIDFSTGQGGDARMAAAIRSLAAAGARVIVDDVTYFDEPMYQESVISKAVDDVAARGVSYFASAGNYNVIADGYDLSSYEAAAFRPMACPPVVAAAEGDSPSLVCHRFSTRGIPNASDMLTFSSAGTFQVGLGWDEPAYGVTTDLDLALVDDATGQLAAFANTNNLKSQQATEFLSAKVSKGNYSLVVARYRGVGTPRLKLVLYRSRMMSAAEYSPSNSTDAFGPTLVGHFGALGASTVAAVPYNNASMVETYSARGPVTYCWGPIVGTTPAAPLHPCVTKQVDIAATTGVQNSFMGGGSLHRFYGTSAAAPHAAAIAALQLEYRRCATPATIRAAQAASGRRVGSFGPDAAGSGLLNALVAVPATRCGQTIRFRALPRRVLGAAAFSVAVYASSSSHLAVSFRTATARVCRVADRVEVALVSPGTCTVVAFQPGSGLFAPAAPVRRSFLVARRTASPSRAPSSPRRARSRPVPHGPSIH